MFIPKLILETEWQNHNELTLRFPHINVKLSPAIHYVAIHYILFYFPYVPVHHRYIVSGVKAIKGRRSASLSPENHIFHFNLF